MREKMGGREKTVEDRGKDNNSYTKINFKNLKRIPKNSIHNRQVVRL